MFCLDLILGWAENPVILQPTCHPHHLPPHHPTCPTTQPLPFCLLGGTFRQRTLHATTALPRPSHAPLHLTALPARHCYRAFTTLWNHTAVACLYRLPCPPPQPHSCPRQRAGIHDMAIYGAPGTRRHLYLYAHPADRRCLCPPPSAGHTAAPPHRHAMLERLAELWTFHFPATHARLHASTTPTCYNHRQAH